MPMIRGGATAFRQWGQYFLFTSFTACSLNFSGGNNIVLPTVLPPQPHLSEGKLLPLPYSGAAHAYDSRYLSDKSIQEFEMGDGMRRSL